jgi:hypothetical protein
MDTSAAVSDSGEAADGDLGPPPIARPGDAPAVVGSAAGDLPNRADGTMVIRSTVGWKGPR